MDSLERQAQQVSVGGYHCPCCGPSPKHRPQHRRTVRRRMSQALGDALINDPDLTSDHTGPGCLQGPERKPLVLIVTDVPGRSEDIAEALERHDACSAIALDDARDAFRLLCEARFDLVLLIDDDEDWLRAEIQSLGADLPLLSLRSSFSPAGRHFYHAGEPIFETGQDSTALRALTEAALGAALNGTFGKTPPAQAR